MRQPTLLGLPSGGARLLGAALLLLTLTAAPLARAAEDPKLKAAIDAVLDDPKLQGMKAGVHVVEVDTGETRYARDADVPLNPASNIKLITAAAALDTLGPHHTFTTRLIATTRDGDRITGDLVLRGDGEGFLLYKNFVAWASQLKRQGVRTIEGDVIVDGAAFGPGTTPPGFDQKQEDAAYRAEVGAVSVNFNAVIVRVAPGAPGQPAEVRLDPPNAHVIIENTATTGEGKRARVAVKAEKTATATKLIISGTIGAQATPALVKKRIDHPAAFAAAVMVQALKDVGIAVKGNARGGQGGDGETLIRHTSEPLSYLLAAMNKWSNNFMAEQVLRALGGKGGAQAGLERSRAIMKQAGVDMTKQKLFNGSGLYTGNLVSARAFTSLLRHMATKHRYGPEFISSLAIAGLDGTLQRRLRDPALRGNLRAKTGTLNQVIGLSGYVRDRRGKLLAFSIIFNDPPVPRAWIYRPQQDKIAQAIAASGE